MTLSKGKRCTSNDTHLGKTPDRINPITIWKSWEWKEPDGGLTAWPLRASHTSLQLVIKGLPTSTLALAWPVLDSNRLWLMELWITSTKTLTNLKVMNTRYKEPQLVTQKIVSLQVFGWHFAFFTLCDQCVAQQKHLLQVEESCCKKYRAGLL